MLGQEPPAPTRATTPRAFRPRGLFRAPRTRKYKWPLLLLVTLLPLAVLVGAATATMQGILGVLIYPAAFLLGAFIGSWTSTLRDGFAAGFMAGWGGFFFGTIVGIPLQVLQQPGSGWTDVAIAALVSPVIGAVFGILLGIIAGLGGILGAKAHLTLRPAPASTTPRA